MNSSSNKYIYIVIGCDVDPDRDYFIKDIPTDSLGWTGMLEGIPNAKKRLVNVVDCEGKPPVFTWNLRVDHQIKTVHGSYDYIIKTHKEYFLELEKNGDELAWHPHFWMFDETKKVWCQNYTDIDWQVEMLKEAYFAYQNIFPGRGKTVRMGWAYHNNRSFSTLSDLGVETEISGCPGLRILPKEKQVRLSNFYDWSITPDKPYHPSVVDYRREAIDDESSLSILAVPNFMSHSFLWGMLNGLVLAKKMGDLKQIGYAISRPTFLSTITVKPSLFKPMMSALKKKLRNNNKVIYSTLFHPDELAENIHPVYSLDNMITNIKSIIEMADKLNVNVKFIKACEAKSIFEE